MTKYSGDDVWKLFEKNLATAKKNLSKIRVFCGLEPGFSGLSGWVYEQTVQYCLRRELRALGINAKIKEQITLVRRAKADLAINDVALEIKSRGLFGKDMRRYSECRKCAKAQGYKYVFVTSGESVEEYRRAIVKALGAKNVFFLDRANDWSRLIGLFVPRQK